MKTKPKQTHWKSAVGYGMAFYLLAPLTLSADTFVTNDVTFQVDMSAQRAVLGPDKEYLRLGAYSMGSFAGWEQRPLYLTNDPIASNTNIFRGTTTIISLPRTQMGFRFCCLLMFHRGGVTEYVEQPLSTGGTNRSFSLLPTNGTLVLPVVRFGDLNRGDILPDPTTVHFNVDMTGAVTVDGHAFDPAVDRVYLNGDFIDWVPCGTSGGGSTVGWAPWEPCSGDTLCQLTNVPLSRVYSAAVYVRPPSTVALTYRYSINGPDNEPTGGTNHVRFVRNTGDYVLPLDRFGSPYQEPSYGELEAARSDPDHVQVSWLGRPGVRLQSCSNPATGPWEDHMETDGLGATNWPVAGSQRFFRLIKP